MNDASRRPQTILLLGGSSEIGLAIVERLATRARTILLAGRDPEHFDETKGRLVARGATTVEWLHFDADKPASHAAFVENVFERTGDLDLVILAFGILGPKPEAGDPVANAHVITTNLAGAISVLSALTPPLCGQGHGTVIVLSSVAGLRVRAANLVYGASKAGLDGYSLALADRLRGAGVRLLLVRPGHVHTKMTTHLPAAPFATDASRVADDVVAALRRDVTIVWSPRILQPIMLVLRHLPRPIFRRIGR